MTTMIATNGILYFPTFHVCIMKGNLKKRHKGIMMTLKITSKAKLKSQNIWLTLSWKI